VIDNFYITDCDSQKSQTQNYKTSKKSAACQAIELSDQLSLDNQVRSEHSCCEEPCWFAAKYSDIHLG